MSEYTGTENLEVMDDAVNCNVYRSRLISTYALPTNRILDLGGRFGCFLLPLGMRRCSHE